MFSLPDLLGINETDFQIFRFLITMGALPASSLATRLNINRTTIFSSLKRLQEKNLIYAIPKKGGTFFAVYDSHQLENNAKTQLKEQEHQYIQMIEMVKQLEEQKVSGGMLPKVAFFEGENGIISLFRKMLVPNTTQQAFLTLEKIPSKILNFLHSDFIEEKKEKNVFSQVLIPQSERSEHYQRLDTNANRETRFVPPQTKFETEIIIGASSLALIDFKEGGIGVYIESGPLCATMKAAFELLWNNTLPRNVIL